jgi:hypothetical protein
VLFFADTVEFFAIKSLEVPSSRSFYFALTLERTEGRHESSQFLDEPRAGGGLLMASFSPFTREQIALEQRQAALQVVTRPSAAQEHAEILQSLLSEEPTAHNPLLSCIVWLQIGFIPISLGNLDQSREVLTHPKLFLLLKTPY